MAYGVRGAYKQTVGEAVSDAQSIADGSALTIRPGAGIVWVIEELGYSGAVTITRTNGTVSTTIDNPSAAGTIEKGGYRISNSSYLVMTNSSGGTLVYSYSGYVVNQ